MDIQVNTAVLSACASKERAVKNKMESLNSQIQSCQSQLKRYLSSSAGRNIDSILSNISTRLSDSANRLNGMADVLDSISKMYSYTEKTLSEHKPAGEKIAGAKNYGSIANVSGGGSGGGGGSAWGDDKDRPGGGFRSAASKQNPNQETAEALDELGKIVKIAAEGGDIEGLEALSSYLGLLSAAGSLSGTQDASELYKNLLGYSGDYLGFSSDVVKAAESVAEKYGSASLKIWMKENEGKDLFGAEGLKTAGHMVSLIEKVYGACQDSSSSAEFMKNISDDVSAAEKVAKDIAGYGEKAEYGTAVPVVALASMTLYAGGDLWEKGQNGFTVQEVSDSMLGTASKGANAFTSAITFGLVEMDTDSFIDIVNKNVDKATDQIIADGGSLTSQVVRSIAWTPVVAAWSVAETYEAHKREVETKIYQLLGWQPEMPGWSR